MGASTKIEWTQATWSPIRASNKFDLAEGWHCEIVTPGCERCYSQAINKRLGTGRQYLRREREQVKVYLDEKMLTQPLRWRKPKMIFVESMSDLFGEWVPDEMIDRIFAVMALCPQHTFQVLTKRAERMRDYLSGFTKRGMIPGRIIGAADVLMPKYDIRQISFNFPAWPLQNVWLGVSVEDQRRAGERIPVLLDTPAALRWLSVEPMLESIDLPWLKWWRPGEKSIHWAVVGGESGPGARPFSIEWARSIIAQCKAAGVACFVKQLGAKPYDGRFEIEGVVPRLFLPLRDRKGGDPLQWAEDLRVREYPLAPWRRSR